MGKAGDLFFLYVAEGLPHGFTTFAIAIEMRSQGVGHAKIAAFISTLSLPWAWKWVVGPVVDTVYSNRLGRRRGWILVTQCLVAASIMAAMFVDFTADLFLFTSMVVLMNIFAATQDVAIDALACGSLREEERGFANGLMFGGSYVGATIGGAGVVFLTNYVPFNSAFLLVAGSVLTVTALIVVPLREQKPKKAQHREESAWQHIRVELSQYMRDAIRAFTSNRSARAAFVFAMLPPGALCLGGSIGLSLNVELGFTPSEIALLATLGGITAAISCVCGGYLCSRFGIRRMLAIYIGMIGLPVLGLAFVFWQHGWIDPQDPKSPNRLFADLRILLAFCVLGHIYTIFQGMIWGSRPALFMDVCDPEVAGIQFTAYMALLNFTMFYSFLWQGKATEAWGYPITMTTDVALGVLGIGLLPWIAPSKKDGDSAVADTPPSE